MESASKGEGDGPGERAAFNDLGKIIGGLLGSLAAREEDDAGESLWDVVLKDFGGSGANFGGSGRGVELFASDDHIDFEETGS